MADLVEVNGPRPTGGSDAGMGTPPGDMAGVVTPTGDMGTTGGTTPKFLPDVQTAINSMGCAASSACHGAGTVNNPKLTANPGLDATIGAANYTAFKQETNATTPEASPILKHLLPAGAGGDGNHGGGNSFTSTSDPNYVLFLNWVKGGTPQ